MTQEEFFQAYPEVCVYDFEVFKTYWLLVIVDAEHPEGLFIESIPALKAAYDERANYVWAGYNNKNYDRFIIGALYQKAGISKADLFALSQELVHGKRDRRHWRLLINDMMNYDVASFSTAGGKPIYSLKQLEAFQGHDIEESAIPWDYDQPFTKEQKESTRHYCLHDVQESLSSLLATLVDFRAQADLIETFGLGGSAWAKTKAQLTAEVLQCRDTITVVEESEGHLYDVEKSLDFSGEEWCNYILPCILLEKRTDILDFYLDADNYREDSLTTDIMGVPHTLGLGGIHGARNRYHQSGGNMLHIDVNSFYPSIMIEWDLLTRRAQRPELFEEIYHKRLELKKAGKKREQQPYKIVINGTFGISNDKYSKGYDPCRNHEVCINGQLMLVMLLERLEGHCDLIQSNTDGIIISYAGYDREQVISICQQWEADTCMSLSYDEIDEIWQKDVNNYLLRFQGGEYDAKGAYVKMDTVNNYPDLGGELDVIRAAVRAGLIAGSEDAVREYIEACTDLRAFQKVVKLTGKYKNAYIGEQQITGHKCFRVFAVTDGHRLTKQKEDGGTMEKYAGTPESCCLVYGDLSAPDLQDSTGQPFTLDRLDREYYIEDALKKYRDMMPV